MKAYFLLIFGFVTLAFGAHLLVDGAVLCARRLKISNLAIGLTVVAFGTSAPELFVNIAASISGNTQLAIGNILGSNIFNILFVLGISSIIFPLCVRNNTVRFEIPFNMIAAALVIFLPYINNAEKGNNLLFTRTDGFISVCLFAAYLYYVSKMMRNNISDSDADSQQTNKSVFIVFYILAGFVLLAAGSKIVVSSASYIARTLMVSENLIGLTVVAMGTSLPELATSFIAAIKKNSDIAVGNVVGSNIFNTFFILGSSAIIRPLAFTNSNIFDALINMLSGFILFAVMFTGKRSKIDRWEGVLFLLAYLCYLCIVVVRS